MPPRSASATTARLLRATWQCVAHDGFQATTAQVAARAGYSPGTLFRHFATKDELLRAALDQAIAELTVYLPYAAPHETVYDLVRRRWEAAGRRALARPLAFGYWALYRATPGLPPGPQSAQHLRLVFFGGADRLLAAVLGTPAQGARAAARLVATWVATVEGLVALGAATEGADEAAADDAAAEELGQGFAAWWAGLGLSRDTPMPQGPA